MNIKRRVVKDSLKAAAIIMFLIAFGFCGSWELGKITTGEWFKLICICSVIGLDALWLGVKL